MNPLSKKYIEERKIFQREIIEIGAVILDEKYNEIGSFTTFVKPQYNDCIEKRIVKLTGITIDQVQSAPCFAEAVNMFIQWCESIPDEIEIYQWSGSDYDQLMGEAILKNYTFSTCREEILTKWKDFQLEYDDVLGLDQQISLQNALMYAGQDFVGSEHDALWDARNTGLLVKTVRTPELCKKALDTVITVLNQKPMETSLGEMFDFSKLGLIA